MPAIRCASTLLGALAADLLTAVTLRCETAPPRAKPVHATGAGHEETALYLASFPKKHPPSSRCSALLRLCAVLVTWSSPGTTHAPRRMVIACDRRCQCIAEVHGHPWLLVGQRLQPGDVAQGWDRSTKCSTEGRV